MYECMYRFNSGNSAHKEKSKKAQQTDGQRDKSKLPSTNYKLTRKHKKTYKNWQLKKE